MTDLSGEVVGEDREKEKEKEKEKQRGLHLLDLPTEILVSILTSFTTKHLLPWTIVCQRFYTIVLRILHFRLLHAASTREYSVILEAYLPSRRYTRPFFYCSYLGTDGISSRIEGEGSLYHGLDEGKSATGKLARLSSLYSRFRPEYPGVKGEMPVRRIAGATPNVQSNTDGLQTEWFAAPAEGGNTAASAQGASNQDMDGAMTEALPDTEGQGSVQQQPPNGQVLPQTQPIWEDGGDGGAKKIIYQLNFDPDELFGQFCLATTLVRQGPRRGVFLSSVPIVAGRPSVIRVWREWLLSRSSILASRAPHEETYLKRSTTNSHPADIVRDSNILWTDYKKNIGLKLGVKEILPIGAEPRGKDQTTDDISLVFDVELKEFIVRTTILMDAVETSQEALRNPGRSLIFGNFAVAAE